MLAEGMITFLFLTGSALPQLQEPKSAGAGSKSAAVAKKTIKPNKPIPSEVSASKQESLLTILFTIAAEVLLDTDPWSWLGCC